MKKLADYADTNGTYNLGSVAVGERTEAIDLIGYSSPAFQYTVADIGTNVVVGLEISLDNIGFDNADTKNEWITKTANRTFTITYQGKMRYIRFYWVSASGGTPTISDITIFGG